MLAAAICICAVSSCDLLEGGSKSGKDEQSEDQNKNNGIDPEKVDWTAPAWYTTNYWERTDREKVGLRGPVKKWHLGNQTPYDEYEYDQAGHLITKYYVDLGTPEENHEWHYTYDAKGRLIRKDYVSAQESPADYTVYEYENEGKFVAMEWFMMGPKISDAEYSIQKDISRSLNVIEQPFSKMYKEITYTFGEDGNLVIKESNYEIYDGSEEKENEQSFEYTVIYHGGYPKSLDSDKLRFKVVNINYYANGMYKDFEYLEESAYNFETGWDRHTYKMLDNPRYFAIESFDLGGTASTMSLTPKWMRRSYDERFEIVRNDEYYGKEAYAEGIVPTYSDTWRNYTYDKYGNWISRIEYVIPRYMGDPSDRDVERIIEYFE